MMTMTHPNHRRHQGFTLVEVLIVVIILGVLAAMVVPQFSNAQSVANASALKHELRYFRTQVMVYRAQHGVAPGHPGGDANIAPSLDVLVAQLTQFTNEKGQTSSVQNHEFRFGPYMQALPVNPINQSSQVRFIDARSLLPSSPVGTEGWLYQPATTTVIANVVGHDELGFTFFDY